MADARLLELIEAEAWADIFRAAPAALAEEHGIAVLDLGAGAACTVARDVPSLMLNRVIGLGVGTAATPAMLDLADEAFGETRYMISVAPQCQPAEISTWLRGRRFEAGYAWMKFERGPEPPPQRATELEVRLAGPEDAGAFARTLIAGYEMPGWMEVGGGARRAAGVELLPGPERRRARGSRMRLHPAARGVARPRRDGAGASAAWRSGLDHGRAHPRGRRRRVLRDHDRDRRAHGRPAERLIQQHHAIRLQRGLRPAQPRISAGRRGCVASGLRPRRSSRGPA